MEYRNGAFGSGEGRFVDGQKREFGYSQKLHWGKLRRWWNLIP
jgi:hypothetical protein